ncbi:MAG: hypothetical protein N7Q72_04840 [Spiroplasma sp. Tabriz.8]|nr:hypothetical protein [Spiroplasma sp. Tabriz.8]
MKRKKERVKFDIYIYIYIYIGKSSKLKFYLFAIISNRYCEEIF